MKGIKNAEILCVGTELLLGDVVNTNATYLSGKLAELGISVYHHTVVGDNPGRLKDALTEAAHRSDLVITSGGLGPTYDDLTKETIAEVFGRRLVRNEQLMRRLETYFAENHRVMTENNRKQAMIPEGGIVFDNNYGTAPAVGIEDDARGVTVIMLPGPPRELEPLFAEEVMPYLAGRSGATLVSRNIHIFGMGESSVESILREMMESSENPTLAPYCKDGEVRLRVTAKAENAETARGMCDEMIEKVKKTEVGSFIYGIDCGTLEGALVTALKEAGKTVTAAESCTGGLIAKRITDIAGSSEVFPGSFVTYSAETKQKILGVRGETIENYGVVSSQTAVEMARGARLALGTDIGISTTGIAGPGGGTPETPVGTVYLGISTKKGDRSVLLTLPRKRERSYIRTLAASNAILLALKEIPLLY